MDKAGILVWLSSQTYKFDRSTNSTYTGFQLSRLSSYIFFFKSPLSGTNLITIFPVFEFTVHRADLALAVINQVLIT